mmetsp:Transcript_5549/g.21860  ORF Transcript_5549/g.21860 Transcript_5549/m.21860 type:complete len:951 (-) Transcript_5549:129-2981(-)
MATDRRIPGEKSAPKAASTAKPNGSRRSRRKARTRQEAKGAEAPKPPKSRHGKGHRGSRNRKATSDLQTSVAVGQLKDLLGVQPSRTASKADENRTPAPPVSSSGLTRAAQGLPSVPEAGTTTNGSSAAPRTQQLRVPNVSEQQLANLNIDAEELMAILQRQQGGHDAAAQPEAAFASPWGTSGNAQRSGAQGFHSGSQSIGRDRRHAAPGPSVPRSPAARPAMSVQAAQREGQEEQERRARAASEARAKAEARAQIEAKARALLAAAEAQARAEAVRQEQEKQRVLEEGRARAAEQAVSRERERIRVLEEQARAEEAARVEAATKAQAIADADARMSALLERAARAEALAKAREEVERERVQKEEADKQEARERARRQKAAQEMERQKKMEEDEERNRKAAESHRVVESVEPHRVVETDAGTAAGKELTDSTGQTEPSLEAAERGVGSRASGQVDANESHTNGDSVISAKTAAAEATAPALEEATREDAALDAAGEVVAAEVVAAETAETAAAAAASSDDATDGIAGLSSQASVSASVDTADGEDSKEEIEEDPANTKSESKRKSKKLKKKRAQARKKAEARGERASAPSRRVNFGTCMVCEFDVECSPDTVPATGEYPLGLGSVEVARREVDVAQVDEERQHRLQHRFTQLPKKQKAVLGKSNPPLESRQWDFRLGVDNPLFPRLSEAERKQRIDECGAADADQDVSATDSASDLDQIRRSRRKVGCSCAWLRFKDLRSQSVKQLRGHLQDLGLNNVTSGLDKDHILDHIIEYYDNNGCCGENCPCFLEGIPCHVEVCSCGSLKDALQKERRRLQNREQKRLKHKAAKEARKSGAHGSDEADFGGEAHRAETAGEDGDQDGDPDGDPDGNGRPINDADPPPQDGDPDPGSAHRRRAAAGLQPRYRVQSWCGNGVGVVDFSFAKIDAHRRLYANARKDVEYSDEAPSEV